MFNRLFGRRSKPAQDATALAMIALRNATDVNQQKLAAALSPLAVGKVEGTNEGSQFVLQVPLAGARAMVCLVDAPIPWTELETPCQVAWQWPDAAELLRPHGAHLILIVPDAKNVIAAQLQLTGVVAATAEATEAIGVYWGAAGMVMSREYFTSFASDASPDDLPIPLWIRFNLTVTNGRTDGSTLGLATFGHPDLEIRESQHSPEEVGSFMAMAANYLITSGPVLKHGQTIGRSAKEKIPIRHEPSKWDPARKVIVLGY
jgi:hypothetical protein